MKQLERENDPTKENLTVELKNDDPELKTDSGTEEGIAKYGTETTLHGLKYIFQKEMHYCEK